MSSRPADHSDQVCVHPSAVMDGVMAAASVAGWIQSPPRAPAGHLAFEVEHADGRITVWVPIIPSVPSSVSAGIDAGSAGRHFSH